MNRKLLLAYLAGVFDGEGCLGAHRRGRGDQLRFELKVNMTDEAIVKLFHETFGGTFYFRPRAKPNYKDQWVWKVSYAAARKTYDELSPYLKLKRIKV